MKRKIILILATGCLLSGCVNASEQPPQDDSEIKVICIVDDIAKQSLQEEKEVVKEPEIPEYTTKNIEAYAFETADGVTYCCRFDNDSLIITAIADESTEYGRKLNENTFLRIKYLVERASKNKDALKENAVSSGVNENDIDVDRWLGEMIYSIARGEEALSEDQTYEGYGFQTLSEIEGLMAGVETVSENEAVEEEQDAVDGVTILSGVSDDEDVIAFKLAKSRYNNIHIDTEGIMNAKAFKKYLKKNQALDRIPFEVDDAKSYYVYVFGSTQVDVKDIKKEINKNKISISGDVTFHYEKNETFDELYIIIPIEKSVNKSDCKINKEKI